MTNHVFFSVEPFEIRRFAVSGPAAEGAERPPSETFSRMIFSTPPMCVSVSNLAARADPAIKAAERSLA